MATSQALFREMSVEDICAGAGWAFTKEKGVFGSASPLRTFISADFSGPIFMCCTK